jgi:hypothetical protein
MPESGGLCSRERKSVSRMFSCVLAAAFILGAFFVGNAVAGTGTFNPPHSDYGLDTDVPPDTLFNYLVVNVSVSITMGGLFIVEGLLVWPPNLELSYDAPSVNLNPGNHIVELNFNGQDIAIQGKDGPYRVDLALYDDNWNTLDTDTYWTKPYFANQFQIPKGNLYPPHTDLGVDTDGNGKFNYLAVDVRVLVNVSCYLKLKGDLYDSGKTQLIERKTVTGDYLQGIRTIRINFTGYVIYGSGFNGPYKVDLWLFDASDNLISSGTHTTAAYSKTDFEVTPASLAPPHSDFGQDLDANALYDYLIVVVKLNVAKSGIYTIEGELWESSGTTPAFIAFTKNRTSLTIGVRSVWLHFLGSTIRSSGINGKYIAYLYVKDVNETVVSIGSHLTSTNYNAASFDPLPAYFSPPHSDYGLDTDSPKNGLYDYLVVNASLSVRLSFTYRLPAYLWNGAQTLLINQTTNTTFLSSGLRKVPLWFDGKQIYNSTYSGPYLARMYLYDPFDNLLNMSSSTTAPYARNSFERYIPPDFSPPSISSVTVLPNPQDVGLAVNISALITDNTQVLGAWVNVAGVGNLSMSYDSGSARYYLRRTYTTTGTYAYTIWATDPSNNWAKYSNSFSIVDRTKPTISSVTASPDPQEVLGKVNITAVIADNYQLQGKWVNIAGIGNFTMSYDVASGRYCYERTYIALATHSFVIWASDSSGNWGSATGGFTVRDSTRPVISNARADPTPQEVPGKVNVSAIISDNFKLQAVWVDIGGIGNFTMSYDVALTRYYHERTYATTAIYSFMIWASDSSGNWAYASGAFTLRDTTPPSISDIMVDPKPLQVPGSVNVSAIVSDNYLLQEIWLDVASVGNLSMSFDPASGRYFLARAYNNLGTFPFTLSARDSNGNWGIATGDIVVEDTIPPSISDLTVIPKDQRVGGIVNISAIINENHILNWTRIEVIDPFGALVVDQALAFSHTVSRYYFARGYSTEGTYTFNVTAADMAGLTAMVSGMFNISTTVIDVTPPDISSHSASPNPQEIHGTVRIIASVTDDVALALVKAAVTSPIGADLGNNTMELGGSTYYRNGTYDELGVYSYCIWAEDTSGNGAKACGQFTIRDATKPVISSMSASPSPQEVKLEVNISAEVTDNHLLQSVEVEVRKPGGQLVGDFTMSFDPALHRYWYRRAYPDFGIHSYTVTATDQSGNSAASAGMFEIRDTTNPVAQAGQDVVIEQGATVTFNGTESTDNDAIENYTWRFMDGADQQKLYGAVSTYVFTNTDTFTVTLVVRDRAGNSASDTMSVTVNPPTQPIKPPMRPTGLTVTVIGTASMQLSWVAPAAREDGSELTGLAGYEVFRSTISGQSYQKMHGGFVTDITYLDSTVERGTTYYYLVRAVDSEDRVSANSTEASGIIPATGFMHGWVGDESMVPLQNANVQLLLDGAEIRTTMTDDWGVFIFSNVEAGNYVLKVSLNGYATKEASAVVGAGSGTDVGMILLQAPSSPPSTGTESLPSFLIFLIIIPTVVVAAAVILLARRRSKKKAEGGGRKK